MRKSGSGAVFARRLMAAALCVAGLLGCAPLLAAPTLPGLIWPLCGRLGEAPGDWQPGQPCPHVAPDPARTDLPIHNGYGLRNFADDSRPVSFHRGLDLATRAATFTNGYVGNPAFAVCSGLVKRITGVAPDQTLELYCPASGTVAADATPTSACNADSPCITAAYRHVQDLLVVENQVVARGDHLGYTGSTAPGGAEFKHLHFEFLDPRERPSNGNGGRTAFSKDSINPLRYLPIALPGAPTVDVALDRSGVFSGYSDGIPALVLAVAASSGFQYDFAALEVSVLQPSGEGGAWQVIGKDLGLIAAEGEVVGLSEFDPTLDVAYPVADGEAFVSRHDPERISRFYTPFSDDSSLWQAERLLTWYRVLSGSAHPGLDGLLERNADARMTDGHLVHDFDFRLIRPRANPGTSIELPSDPAEWWGLQVGLREFGSVLDEPYCVRAVVEQIPTTVAAEPRRQVRWLAQPDDFDCAPAQAALRIFRNGFEPGG